MGFVGGFGNIAIATAQHTSFCEWNCIHQNLIVYGIFICYVLPCHRLWFLDVETNPDPRRSVPAVCRLFCSNVRGLSGNLSDLTVASSRYDILLCSETLVSDMRHVLDGVACSRIWSPGLVVQRADASAPRDGGTRTRWIWSISPTQVWVRLLRNAGF